MDRPDTRALWNANAPAWTELSRAGFDLYRDLVNTPAFFAMLPPVDGLCCLDLGCGEGHNTRLLAGAALLPGRAALLPGGAALPPGRPGGAASHPAGRAGTQAGPGNTCPGSRARPVTWPG